MSNVAQIGDELSLGQLARLAVDIRTEKDELNKLVKGCTKRLDEVKALIYANLNDSGLDRAAVDGVSVSISNTVQPNVTDWDAVHAYVLEHENTSLLQRRITSTLWREMYEAGEIVPGIEVFNKHDVNIRKNS